MLVIFYSQDNPHLKQENYGRLRKQVYLWYFRFLTLREYLISRFHSFFIKSGEHKIAKAEILSQFHVVYICPNIKSEILKFS